MVNKGFLSHNEIIHISLLVFLPIYILLSLVSLFAVLLGMIIYISLVVAYFYIVKYVSRNLPGTSAYTLYGVIEIHVDKVSNGNVKNFLQICSGTIIQGIQENKNVVFANWLVSKKLMRLVLGDAVKFYKLSWLENLVIKRNRKKFKGNKSKPIIGCIIEVNKLSAESIRKLKSFK